MRVGKVKSIEFDKNLYEKTFITWQKEFGEEIFLISPSILGKLVANSFLTYEPETDKQDMEVKENG